MKKFLSVLLAIMMVVTILPVNLLAMPIELEEHSHSEPALNIHPTPRNLLNKTKRR